MKRTLYFTSLVFLFLPPLVAQETFNQSFVDEQWDTQTNTWVPYARNQAAYDEAGRYLGAYLEEVREGEWIQTYYSDFTYHGTSDQIDRRETYSYQPQFDFTLSYWRNFEYTEEGWILLSDTKTVTEDLEGVPYDSSYIRRTWSYGTSGEVLAEEIYREQLSFSGTTISVDLTEYSYDAAGCETRRVFSQGRPGDLIPTRQIRTLRNANCEIQEEIEEVWMNPGSFWEFERRTVYTYTSGNLSEVISYQRDLALNVWKEQEREIYEQLGDTLRISAYAWDEMTNDWDTEVRTFSSEVKVNGGIRMQENQSSSLWTIRIYDEKGRQLSSTQKLKDQDEEWVDFFVETNEYDGNDRVVQETRSWDYDKELGLYQGILIVENTYVESQVLLQVNTTVSQRDWISSEGRYNFAASTSSVTYDYYCDDQLRSRITTSNGVNQRRRRVGVDQSLRAACGEGPDNALTVYPNPAQDQITVKVDGESRQPLEIEILDQQGRLAKVWKMEVGLFLTEVDISDLLPGLYLARTNKAGDYQYFKFVKTAD
ncbi:MAG: T9SS type A sorting domain-containing protein [Bacteroidota bacterium]